PDCRCSCPPGRRRTYKSAHRLIDENALGKPRRLGGGRGVQRECNRSDGEHLGQTCYIKGVAFRAQGGFRFEVRRGGCGRDGKVGSIRIHLPRVLADRSLVLIGTPSAGTS